MDLRELNPPLRFRPEDARAQRSGKPVVTIVESGPRRHAWIFLPSGLQVMAPLQKLPIIDISVTVRHGGLYDTIPGTAHAIEHLIYRDVLEVGPHPALRPLIGRGLRYNAFTQDEMTYYWGRTPYREWKDLLAGLLTLTFQATPLIEPVRWERERPAILEEIRGRDESKRISDALRAALYPHVARLRTSLLGDKSDVERLTTDDLRQVYEAVYHPGNAVVIIQGLKSVEALLAWLTQRPEAWGNGPSYARVERGPFTDPGLDTDLTVRVAGGPSVERIIFHSQRFRSPRMRDKSWRMTWLLREIMGRGGLVHDAFRRRHGLIYSSEFLIRRDHADFSRFILKAGMRATAMDDASAVWKELWKRACNNLKEPTADVRPFIETAFGAHRLGRASAKMQAFQDYGDGLRNEWLEQERRRPISNMGDVPPEELLPLLRDLPRFADLHWQEIRVLPTSR